MDRGTHTNSHTDTYNRHAYINTRRAHNTQKRAYSLASTVNAKRRGYHHIIERKKLAIESFGACYHKNKRSRIYIYVHTRRTHMMILPLYVPCVRPPPSYLEGHASVGVRAAPKLRDGPLLGGGSRFRVFPPLKREDDINIININRIIRGPETDQDKIRHRQESRKDT